MTPHFGKNPRFLIEDGLGSWELVGVVRHPIGISGRRQGKTWSSRQPVDTAPSFLRPWLDCVDAYTVSSIRVSPNAARYKVRLYRGVRDIGEVEVDGPGGIG